MRTQHRNRNKRSFDLDNIIASTLLGFFLTVMLPATCLAQAGPPLVLFGTDNDNLLVIHQPTGAVFEVGSIGEPVHALAFDFNTGTLLGITDFIDNPTLIEIDQCTGATTPIGPVDLVDPPGDGRLMEGLAFNLDDGILYGALGLTPHPASFRSHTLVTVDPTSGAAIEIAPITNTIQKEADALAFVEGTLYAPDCDGQKCFLYTLDHSTGIASLIARVGLFGRNAYNPDTQTLYAFNPTTLQLATIDPANGQVTVVATTGRDVFAMTAGIPCPTNVPPVVESLTLPVDPVEINTEIIASATFTDANATDTHTATWDWGDGTTSPGTVTEPNGGPGTITGTHTYTEPSDYTVTVTVIDNHDASDSGSATVDVIDVNPPEITLATGPFTLWPPDHKYHTLAVEDFVTGVSDEGDPDISLADVVITAVSSDEPEDAPDNGDGNTVNDIVITTDCRSVDLRAERQGGGNGRVYTIEVAVEDASGNVGVASFQVQVPHEVHGVAVDDGAASGYTVTSACGAASAAASVATAPIDQAASLAVAGDQDAAAEVPEAFALAQNYPNPFNPSTEIRFDLPEAVEVRLVIYDVQGREVARLVNGSLSAGHHRVTWDARQMPSGVYVYRIEAGAFVETRRMVLLR